ncbi:hypothetical protein IEQ34_021781 [Dendrobium chrysotoxum]|uniref:Uncharacterized protein n=1 Tax=Dendrobium chrysotoxum TaxID=161865 RepID=A0AAV7G536_DENCH|nr:hypothetical protein IEQ34_021781 [Dendrobium chrysotoxum]
MAFSFFYNIFFEPPLKLANRMDNSRLRHVTHSHTKSRIALIFSASKPSSSFPCSKPSSVPTPFVPDSFPTPLVPKFLLFLPYAARAGTPAPGRLRLQTKLLKYSTTPLDSGRASTDFSVDLIKSSKPRKPAVKMGKEISLQHRDTTLYRAAVLQIITCELSIIERVVAGDSMQRGGQHKLTCVSFPSLVSPRFLPSLSVLVAVCSSHGCWLVSPCCLLVFPLLPWLLVASSVPSHLAGSVDLPVGLLVPAALVAGLPLRFLPSWLFRALYGWFAVDFYPVSCTPLWLLFGDLWSFISLNLIGLVGGAMAVWFPYGLPINIACFVMLEKVIM